MELLAPEFGLLFWTLFTIIILVLPLLALFSLLRSTFRDSTTKLIWLLVILFVPVIGSSLYFMMGRPQRVKTV